MRNNSIVPTLLGTSLVVLAAALCSPPAAWAAVIWVGGVDNNFNNTANWDDSKDPTGEACYFYWGTPTYVDLNVGSAISVYSLATTYTGGTVGTAPVTISGEQMSLTGPTGITTGSQGRGLTINSNLTVSGTAEQRWDVGSDPVTINGGVSGAYDFGIKQVGTGTLTLNGVGAFGAASQAGLTIDRGKVIFGNEAALGANGSYRGGSLTVRSGSSWDSSMSGAHTLTSNNTLVLYEGGGGTFTFVGSNSLNMGTGGAYFNSGGTPGTFNLVVSDNELTIGGDVEIKDGSSLTKQGAGALTLNGATTSSTGTELIVDEGRLNIGHASAVGGGNLVFKASTTFDATSDLTLSMAAGRAIKFYGGDDFTEFTFAGSHNLNMGANDVAVQAGNAHINVVASTLTFGGNVEGDSYNLYKSGDGTLVLDGGATNNGLISDKGTLVLGAAADIKGETIMGSGVTAVWVTGNGDAYDATYKVEFDGTKSVSNHDVRSQLSAYPDTGIVSLRAQVFATDTPSTGDITMQWRERSESESISDLLISNVLDLSGSAVPSKYLLAMTYDPNSLVGDEAAMAAAGAIFVVYNDDTLGWVNAGLEGYFQGDNPVPTTIAAIDAALDDMEVGFYGVDSDSNVAWVVLDHASEFAVVPEPGTLALLATGLLGLLAYAWRRRK